MVAAALGVVVGELAAMVLLSGSIDHRLDEHALRNAGSAPAVAQASASLQQTKDARAALDSAVDRAHQQQDQALVIARCEYHPTPACPQTRITGVPGAGPETRTANELLADAQHELDNALAARDRQAPALDAEISREERALDEARHGVVVDTDRGLGARWVAMNDLTSADAGTLMLRLLTIAFCVLLYLLPLILGRWRGETTHDRHAAARAERERAELEADTAIAIKRAEVRREAEILWAEHQLTQARLAIEAQTEIDREQQRRRIVDAFDPPVRASSQRTFEPADDDIYLPIAAEAEAASRAIVGQPAPAPPAGVENLPAPRPTRHCAARRAWHVADPVDSGRHQGRGAVGSPAGAAVRGAGDRHHDRAVAHRASGLRGGRGDHLRAAAHPQSHGRHRKLRCRRATLAAFGGYRIPLRCRRIHRLVSSGPRAGADRRVATRQRHGSLSAGSGPTSETTPN